MAFLTRKTTIVRPPVDPSKPVDPRDLETNQHDEVHFPLPGYEILVANLFRGARRSWILEEFRKYGPITELRVCFTRKHSGNASRGTGKKRLPENAQAGYECRGWALVRYLRREDAEAAQLAKDGWAYAAPNTISRTIRVLPTDENRALYCAGFPKDWDRAKLQGFLEQQGVRGLAAVDLIENGAADAGEGSRFAFLTFEDRAAAVAAKNAHGVGPDNMEPSPNIKANPVLPKEGGAKLRLPYEGPGGAAGAEQLREDAKGWLVHAGEGAGDAPAAAAAAGWWTEERRSARTEYVEKIKRRGKQPYRDVPAEEQSELDRANNAYWAVRGMITGTPAGLTHEALAAAPPPPQPLVVPATGERLLVHFADPLRLHAHLNGGHIVTKLTEEQQKVLNKKVAEQKQRKRLKLKADEEFPPRPRGVWREGGSFGSRPDEGFPARMVNGGAAGGPRGGPGGPGNMPGTTGPQGNFNNMAQGMMMPHGNRMMPQGNNMMHQNNGGPPMGMMGNDPSSMTMHQRHHGGANIPGGGGTLTAISSQLNELMQSTRALEARLQGIQTIQQHNQPQSHPGAHAPQQWGPSLQHQQGGMPPPVVMGDQQRLLPPQQHTTMQQVGESAVQVVRYQPGGAVMQQQQQQQQPMMQQAVPVVMTIQPQQQQPQQPWMQQQGQQQPQQPWMMQQGQPLPSATVEGGAAVQQPLSSIMMQQQQQQQQAPSHQQMQQFFPMQQQQPRYH